MSLMKDLSLPGLLVLPDFDDAWATPGHAAQLRAVVSAGSGFGERFAKGPQVVAVRSLPLTTLPYPTRYAFGGAAFSPAPFVTMTHRCLLVQFMQRGEPKTLLFNPSDVEGARATPFFARLARDVGERASSWMAKRYDSIETQLATFGLSAEDIDYVAFDHFHTQDLRGLLGTRDGKRKARFPNAVLLAPEVEWRDWDDLHPMQRAWFVHDGKSGVDESRVVFTSNDLLLGDGVAIVRTPGHTSGNQTLFVSTSRGVWGISENGTCVDNWSPAESKIPGLSFTAKTQDLDVVLNANTPELFARQYTSMMLEKSVVSRVARAPAFVQMLSSSEVTPSLTAPLLRPTLVHGGLTVGDVVAPRRARSEKAS